MKIIFLDVDGVLNSMTHYEKVKNITKDPLDSSCVHLLGEIVRASGAKIVLTSTWRGGWEKDPDQCHLQGQILNRYFQKEGLEIYDKTPNLIVMDGTARCQEIRRWIQSCPYKIESYIIIDDGDFKWQKYGLAHRWIQTDFQKNGLEEGQKEECIQLLNKTEWRLFYRNLFRKEETE